MYVAKEVKNRTEKVSLSCPNCRTFLAIKGSTENNDFSLFECKSSTCPLKAVILVTEQVSEIMKQIVRY